MNLSLETKKLPGAYVTFPVGRGSYYASVEIHIQVPRSDAIDLPPEAN
jgi:hypothetical protein